MTADLVEIIHKQAVTSSLKIASHFGKSHKDVLEKIRILAAEISATKLDDGYNPKFIEKSYVDARGKVQPYFEMNRDGFTEVVGNMNGVKAREWKRKYHAAFNQMEQRLTELAIQRQNEEWREARQLSVTELRKLTDTIRDVLIPQMKREGASDAAIKWVYKNYVSMIQKILGIKKGTRNELPAGLLYELGKVEDMTRVIIRGLSAAGTASKQIYDNTKIKIEGYAQLSLFNQRFLEE